MKFPSLAQAVEANVRDGDSVAMEGFTRLNGWPNQIAIEEHAHAAMANAYEAGAAGLPLAVFRGYIGADLPKVNPNRLGPQRSFTGG